MIRFINKLIFKKILGWRIEGFIPEDKKIIAIVAPHTSWHDFFVGIFKPLFIGGLFKTT